MVHLGRSLSCLRLTTDLHERRTAPPTETRASEREGRQPTSNKFPAITPKPSHGFGQASGAWHRQYAHMITFLFAILQSIVRQAVPSHPSDLACVPILPSSPQDSSALLWAETTFRLRSVSG